MSPKAVAGRRHHPVDGGVPGRGHRPARRGVCAHQMGVEEGAGLASTSSVTSTSSSIVRFSTAPSERTTTSRASRGRQADHLDRADGGRIVRGPDHDGGVGGELGEQPGGPLEHVLHLAVDLVEEGAHLLVLGRPEDAGLGQVVDEEAVALVGRDPPGAGVRLDQVAVALEGHHLGAHGGRGDLHPGGIGHVQEPTGWAVPMYSVTTASRMAALRSLRARASP